MATAVIRVNLAFSFATLSGEADGDLSVFEIMWTYMPIMEMQGMIIFKKIWVAYQMALNRVPPESFRRQILSPEGL